MNRYNRIHTLSLLKTLFINIFSSRYVDMFFNLIMTTLISLHSSKVDFTSKKWVILLIMYIIITLILNSLCILAGYIKQKNKTVTEYYNMAYDIQSSMNCDTAAQLYRVNKKINKTIREGRIEKHALNSIADFQTLSFKICNELYNFITSSFNCGECEVTIFQRFTDTDKKDFVKMIAYRNSRNKESGSYHDTFKLSHQAHTRVPVFVNVFNDLNADIKILHNQKAVEAEFKYFDHSMTREKKICQYIGIPIKTNRNYTEILLQIDVSKEKALGNNYNAVKQLADNIIVPFSNMLYCSYERDLIFDKFYDILEENIIIRGGV